MRSAERLLARVLDRLVRQGTLALTFADGTTRTFGTPAAAFPDVAMRFADARVARDTLLDMRLGFAEAWIDGRVIIEQGDIMQVVTLLRHNTRWEERRDLAPPSPTRKLAVRLRHLAKSFNRPGSARRNVAHHYDIGNALYRLMLDETHMQYSCAYWPRPDMELAEAQTAKLAHIAAKLAITPGMRVLDIGCGWGGMAIYLAQHTGAQVLGITLSAEQLALAQERAAAAGVADRVRFELVDYRDLATRGERFDRIVSVGMFEHVGQPQFTTFFRACAALLAPDGAMLLHTIGRMGGPGRTDAFTARYIFPGGYIPALSETLAASESVRLIATDVEVWRRHYAPTLHAWYRKCLAHRAEIEALFDERFFRMWTFYLAGAATAFETGGMCNYQVQYVLDRDALPLTRDYMAEREQALLAG
ncbi:cyclopropane-fatty-acyl-phospholipid synthase [Croceibacterium mercuriale]|uniref:Cyclopropane-fatty-acyl-phospholipid synthase n=1 Tax=Croceibacterium mercuriale TaxID=1572751 RepID=A0A0B2C044_9SPHN|nr:cyclopropane-fatty-acyl-phospholipid synthase family protein [Croceibacterium mercuriale]KHL25637.1 cyclopropane-fatty-acyl-phospholipid synthase [Croceibacterium mercuriale]